MSKPCGMPHTNSQFASRAAASICSRVTSGFPYAMFDAIVVGMQLATIIPASTLGSIAPERTPPAAITICTMTDDRALERTFSFLISPLRRYTHRDRSRYEEFPF